jgi:hypothetical protein
MTKMTPQERWDADTRALRFPDSPEALRERFVLTETRRVRNDNVIKIDRIEYEVPRGHAGEYITVVRRLLDDAVLVLHDGKLVRVHPADKQENALSPRARAKPPAPPPDTDECIPITAAQLAFDKDFGSLIGPDGDYESAEKGEEEP